MDKLTDTARQEIQQNEIAARTASLEEAVLSVIARRIAKIDENTTTVQTREWLAQDLARIRKLMEEGSLMLTEYSDVLLDEMARLNDEWAAPYYEAHDVNQLETKDNQYLTKILMAGKYMNAHNIQQMCRTSVLQLQLPDGGYAPIENVYKAICDEAIAAINTGAETTVKATTRAVRALAQGGVRVQYASGATRDLYSAASMNIMDGFRVTMQDLRNQQADEFGADGVEISAHSLCAEDHQPYQGKQYTVDEFERINRKLKRPIGDGYNCRHTVTRIVLGVSNPANDREQLKKMRAASNRKVKYTGLNGEQRELTAYQFTQYQRQVETTIRRAKIAEEVARAAGDPAEVAHAKRYTRSLISRYNAMSREAGISTRPERYRVYKWR